MPTINRECVAKLHELTALFYKNQIPCPPLVALNDWVVRVQTEAGATPMPATPAARSATPSATGNGAAAPGGQGTLTAAKVLALIAAQPDGIHDATLRQTLADEYCAAIPERRRKAVIGTLIARMKKGTKNQPATITQKGQLWFAKAPRKAAAPKAAKEAGTVDKTIGARRTRRARGAQAAEAGNGAAEGQGQAASAG